MESITFLANLDQKKAALKFYGYMYCKYIFCGLRLFILNKNWGFYEQTLPCWLVDMASQNLQPLGNTDNILSLFPDHSVERNHHSVIVWIHNTSRPR